MIALLQGLGATTLIVGVYLLAWAWVPLTAIFLPLWLVDHRDLPIERARHIGFVVCMIGIAAILAAWNGFAPHWLRHSLSRLADM